MPAAEAEVPAVDGLDEAIATLDADGDGMISAVELHTLLLPKLPALTIEKAKDIHADLLKNIDKNGDGQISVDEIKAYWASKGASATSAEDVTAQLRNAVLQDVQSKITTLFVDSDRAIRSLLPAPAPASNATAATQSSAKPATKPAAAASAVSKASAPIEIVVETQPAGAASTAKAPPKQESVAPAKPAAEPPSTTKVARRPSSVSQWGELMDEPGEEAPAGTKALFVCFFGGCSLLLVAGVAVGYYFYSRSPRFANPS